MYTNRFSLFLNAWLTRFPSFLIIAVSNARIVGDRDVLVQFGSDINLTCRSEDAPQPPASVLWYKDGVRVDSLLAR